MTQSEDRVIEAAQRAFLARLPASQNVSENTKNAQAIAKAWRAIVHHYDPDRYQIEALVAPELDQRIDVFDTVNLVAYEFKVSGKNAWAEFYKNVVKIIIWNEWRNKKIQRLVFITGEEHGRPFLERHKRAPWWHGLAGEWPLPRNTSTDLPPPQRVGRVAFRAASRA